MKISSLIVLLVLFTSCQSEAQTEVVKESKNEVAPTWSSKFYPFSFNISENEWKKTIYSDKQQWTSVGLSTDSDSISCHYRITSTTPRSQLSDSDYYKSISENMQYTDPEFVFIVENDTTFHEQTFHQLIFDIYVKSKGILRQHFLIYRTDEMTYQVIITYPIDKKGSATAKTPQELIELDKNITLKTVE